MKKIFLCLLLCMVLCCGCGQKSYLSSGSSSSSFGEASNNFEQESEKKSGYVQILGAVNSPGVYEITEDTRLFMVIQAAGGLRDDASAESVNQAKPLSDGESIYIKTVEEVLKEAEESSNSDGTSEESENNDGRINVNKASLAELMTLPGIGESKAKMIIDYRNEKGDFNSIEDIMNVEGIKEGTFNRIKDSIKV